MKTMPKIMAQLLPQRNVGFVSHSLIMVLPKGEMWLLLAIITTVCPRKNACHMHKQIPENKYEIQRNINKLKFYCRKHSE